MAYEDAASFAALTVAQGVLADATRAAGVVRVGAQAVADAVKAAEQARDDTQEALSTKADVDLSNVQSSAVAALVGSILLSTTSDGAAAPAILTLRPVSTGSTIFGLFVTPSA